MVTLYYIFVLLYLLFSTSASILDVLFPFGSRKGQPILLYFLSFSDLRYVTLGTVRYLTPGNV